MALSEVYGLDRFREYMEGFEDCYTVIGGTACDIILSDADLPFRATKDIDLILLIESRLPEVGRAVWQLVKDGGYRCGWKGSDEAHLIPFKAKAYVDLSARKARGEHVNTGDLKKHKKDVFRLAQLLRPELAVHLVPSIEEDMLIFCDMSLRESVPMQQLGLAMTIEEALDLLRLVYGLS